MIRPATREDASQIAAIYNHYVENTVITFEEQPISGSEMRARITNGIALYPWLVAEIAGTVLGYAYATEWKPRAGL